MKYLTMLAFLPFISFANSSQEIRLVGVINHAPTTLIVSDKEIQTQNNNYVFSSLQFEKMTENKKYWIDHKYLIKKNINEKATLIDVVYE